MAITGNTNYIDNAAVAINVSIRKDWEWLPFRATPILAVMKAKGLNFNKKVRLNADGNKVLLAVAGDDQANVPAGVAPGASEIVAMTPNLITGLTQAEYFRAQYRGNYIILESDLETLAQGSRGNILEAKKEQAMKSFENVLAGHISDTNADTSSRILGLRQPLSVSNTVGNISQATDTDWQAQVDSTGGNLTLARVDRHLNKFYRFTSDNSNPIDLLLCSTNPSGLDTYQTLVDQVLPHLRVTNEFMKTKFGIEFLEHRGVMLARDHRAPVNRVDFISTKTWWAGVPDEPTFRNREQVSLTTAYEQVFLAWCYLACGNPQKNGSMTNLT